MKSLHPLRKALLLNALFSTVCAVIFLSMSDTVATWMGFDYPDVYRIVGIGLILFASDLCHQATRSELSVLRAKIASIGDFAWVAGTIIVVLFFRDHFSALGVVLLLSVSSAVLIFGILQTRGIKLIGDAS